MDIGTLTELQEGHTVEEFLAAAIAYYEELQGDFYERPLWALTVAMGLHVPMARVVFYVRILRDEEFRCGRSPVENYVSHAAAIKRLLNEGKQRDNSDN